MSKKGAGPANASGEELLQAWGTHIDPELLVLALTHRSFANEMGGLPHNERLEFLGDSVLSIVVTDHLFHRFPDKPESELAKMRAAVVSQTPLAAAARTLRLGEYILLGVGENKSGGRDKDSILSDTVEALIGATYLSNGLEKTRGAVLHVLREQLDNVADPKRRMDWKTPLAEAVAGTGREIEYRVEGFGPDHAREFKAEVLIGGELFGSYLSSPKRHAENLAAREALQKWEKEQQ